MYSNNDFRYYKGGSYLAHYGVKGMKWKKKEKSQWDPNNRPVARRKTTFDTGKKNNGLYKKDHRHDFSVNYGNERNSLHNLKDFNSYFRKQKIKKKKSWIHKLIGR